MQLSHSSFIFYLLFLIALLLKHFQFSNLSHYWLIFHPSQNWKLFKKRKLWINLFLLGVHQGEHVFCFMYFEALSLRSYVFKTAISSYWNDSIILLKWHSLFLTIFFALKYTSSNINTNTSALFLITQHIFLIQLYWDIIHKP